MSTLTALAMVQAVRAGQAQPIATVRHVRLHDRPLVVIPLALAGEANAPLAALVGDDRHAPQLLVVPQPRNREQRFGFAAALGRTVASYVDSFATDIEPVAIDRGKEIRLRCVDAPQILVPNPTGVHFLRLLGRSTRFRRPDGDFPVDPLVPLLGRWLTFFAERAEHPGSCLLMAATDALRSHWASGQSAIEDQNLAALLGWIDPPEGMTGAQAAALAEDPVACPPAGPATDPTFDREVLLPLIESGDVPRLSQALTTQLEPTWALLWRAVDVLRGLPAGVRVAMRWEADRDAFTAYLRQVVDGAPPQPRRDSAVAAAQRLNWLERAQAVYAAQRAMDDPLVLADYRLSGEAFAGVVVAVEGDRVVGAGRSRKLRPLITVRTTDPVRLAPGATLVAITRPGQKATMRRIEDGDGGVGGSGGAEGGGVEGFQSVDGGIRVELELSGGMGRAITPREGSVPELGERICYTSIVDSYQPMATFPSREDTPWTHGGPPADYVPTDDDTAEEWS